MAGLGPATHDFSYCQQQSRGWPAFEAVIKSPSGQILG
jgi:hypothetical protein